MVRMPDEVFRRRRLNAVVWIVMLEVANRLVSDTFYLQSRHSSRLTGQ
jgi:hypothetical protein